MVTTNAPIRESGGRFTSQTATKNVVRKGRDQEESEHGRGQTGGIEFAELEPAPGQQDHHGRNHEGDGEQVGREGEEGKGRGGGGTARQVEEQFVF